MIGHRRALLGLLAVVMLVAAWTAAAQPTSQSQPTTTTAPTTRFTISRETTYFTGPLRPDGTVDYLVAINKEFGKGVTPENNAVVPLIRAVGADVLPEAIRRRTLTALGIEHEPAGPTFVPLRKFAQALPADKRPASRSEYDTAEVMLDDQREEARKRPWRAEEFPLLDEWLRCNERPLLLVVEASKRPRFWMPLLADECKAGCAIDAVVPLGVANYKEAARAVAARAMRKLSSGDIVGAQDDVMAVHRLGRLIARGPTLIGWLIGAAVENAASEADQGMAASGRLSANQARAQMIAISDLPEFPTLAHTLTFERAVGLDIATALVARKPNEAVEFCQRLAMAIKFDSKDVALITWWQKNLDEDLVLRVLNAQYDNLPGTVQVDRAGRQIAKTAFELDIKQVEGRAKTAAMALREAAQRTDPLTQEARQRLSLMAADLMLTMLSPGVGRVADIRDRALVNTDMARAALTLAAFKADVGKFPAKLDELSPKYMKTIPLDLFSGKPLIYKPTAAGYILYSVGTTGQDNGGKEDWQNGVHILEVPPKPTSAPAK